jgi:hypothetical protein
MLFKPEHIGKILNGKKTQTRRTGKLKYKVGRRYRVQPAGTTGQTYKF